MPRNAQGVYTVPPGTNAVSLTTIGSDVYNNFLADISQAITNSLCTNGVAVMGVALNMNGWPINNLGAPVNSNDAATKLYVDNGDGARVAKAGDTMRGPLVVNMNAANPQPSTLAGTPGVQISGADATATRLLIDAYGQAPFVDFRRADGTAAAPTALAVNDIIGSCEYSGYTGSGYNNIKAAILCEAGEAWTPTANGTRLHFYTTQIGTTTVAEAARIQPSGGVSLGTATFNATDPGQGNLAVQGLVTAASPSLGDNSNKLATTAFVQATIPSGGGGGASYVLKTGDTMTGNLTIAPASGAADLSLNALATGQQSLINLYEANAVKWQLGRQTDDSFVLYDYVNAAYALQVSTAGNVTLGEPGKTVTSNCQIHVAPTSQNSVLYLDAAAGFQPYVNLKVGATTLSQITATAANPFLAIDLVNGQNFINLSSAGNVTLGEPGKNVYMAATTVVQPSAGNAIVLINAPTGSQPVTYFDINGATQSYVAAQPGTPFYVMDGINNAVALAIDSGGNVNLGESGKNLNIPSNIIVTNPGTYAGITLNAIAGGESYMTFQVNGVSQSQIYGTTGTIFGVQDTVNNATAIALNSSGNLGLGEAGKTVTLQGVATAPTPGAGDNSTKIATTAFVAAAVAGQRVLLNTLTPSNVASITDTTSVQSGYSKYDVELENITTNTGGVSLQLQPETNGGFSPSAVSGRTTVHSGSAVTTAITAFLPLIPAGAVMNAGYPAGMTAKLQGFANTGGPAGNPLRAVWGSGAAFDGSLGTTFFEVAGGCEWASTTTIVQALRFAVSAGLFSGTIKIYGYN